MTQSSKRAVWALRIWGPVTQAFMVLFFYVGTPATYADTRPVRLLVGAIFVLVYVFILAIGLWENYRVQGSVPVGWMWFLAYSTSLMAFISSSATTLVLHKRSQSHG